MTSVSSGGSASTSGRSASTSPRMQTMARGWRLNFISIRGEQELSAAAM